MAHKHGVYGVTVRVRDVIAVVARYHQMTEAQLLERTRRHSVARPRQIAMYLATQVTPSSLPEIGALFGGFDHTTVMYARDRVIAELERDENLQRAVDYCWRQLDARHASAPAT